jgi:hypothetical protein
MENSKINQNSILSAFFYTIFRLNETRAMRVEFYGHGSTEHNLA